MVDLQPCNKSLFSRMGQKFAIFILLWISLTFNFESNEIYSYFLVFYFLYARLETGRIM